LYEHLVKFIQVLRVPIGLNGNIVITDGCGKLNAIAQISVQLKVKAGVHYYILAISKRKPPAETTIIGNIPKVEHIVVLLFLPSAGIYGADNKTIHYGIESHPLGGRVQP
jgi:hypothetical protein